MIRKSLIAIIVIGLLLSLTGLANSAWRAETISQDAKFKKALPSNSQDGNTPPHKDPPNRKPHPEQRHPWGEVLANNSPKGYTQNILEKNIELMAILQLADLIF